MVEVDIWKRLSLGERIYARIRRWKDEKEKIENMLLRGATEEEKTVYHNMKKVDIGVMRSYAKDAVEKLDSGDWRIQAYGAGEIGAFEEISCYIGYWIRGNYIVRRNKKRVILMHRWLYVNPEIYERGLSKHQKNILGKIHDKIQLIYEDYKIYKKFGLPSYREYDKGRESMRQEFEKLGLAFWSL